MSLRINEGSRTFDYSLEPSLVLFAQAERRLSKKKDALEDMQNEYNLLEQQAFNLYKSHIDYMKLDASFIAKSRRWLEMKKSGKDSEGNKLDGRKKYSEKDTFEYIHNALSDFLGIDDMIIETIMVYNWGEANEFVFTSHGHKWELTVPNIREIKLASYQRYGGRIFKLRLSYYDSEHCTSWVGDTFEEEKLKDIFQEGLEKFEGGEKNEQKACRDNIC